MSKEPQKTSHTNLANESKSEQTKQKTFNLQMNVSDTLLKKLKDKAQRESITTEELATELLSEGLVLRAWEIMERKSTMRGNSNSNNNFSQHPQNRSTKPSGFRSQGNNRKNNNPGRKAHNNGNNINSGPLLSSKRSNKRVMEDSSQFLEYVRNQEKANKIY